MRVIINIIVVITALLLCACSSQTESNELISEAPLGPTTSTSRGESFPPTLIQSEYPTLAPTSTDVQNHELESLPDSLSLMSDKTGKPSNLSAYEFHDIAIKECIERYFDKDASTPALIDNV